MFAAATTLFAKPTSLSSYTLHSAAPSPSHSPVPGSSASVGGPSSSAASGVGVGGAGSGKAFGVGLWRVTGATHKTTGKDVSVWTFEKRVLEGVKGDSAGRGPAAARDWVLEQLKKEATSLSRLRHPDILHTVEPLEETRSELIFVTEYITASLAVVLQRAVGRQGRERDSARHRPPSSADANNAKGEVDLDEVEIQKGTLQIARGLAFLHGPAKSVHLNLTPSAILINAKGDWKLSGLGLTTPLQRPDGSATKYEFPEVDGRLPAEVQWKLNYLAPEYALDSQLTTASDLYSLGCVLFAVHMGGKPPYSNHGSLQSLRTNVEGLGRRDWANGSRWERCSPELKDLLPRLLTRHPSSRLSLASLPSHPFFSSLAISTLSFLDPTTFASKPREEKATFLRGLVRVLPTFSDRLRRGKILPSLLEEMKDSYLLPFILPNVFEISKTLSKEEFTVVLPKLQPLFALKDPPQNMLTLLENLTLFEEKTLPAIFRENVMPLIYNSLECEHLPVQEKVLKLVPHLCEVLDYGTVHNVLLVKVAILFTRTRALSVKVLTLDTFRLMVATLDKTTLTTKLVPLLAKIKTKEPAVMMATLGVHEAMGAKVDREATATLVLPQLWAMSMGPLLNAEQFGRFMSVIRALGERVAREHGEHLRDVRRLEQSQARGGGMNGVGGAADMSMGGWEGDGVAGAGASGGEVDFETLVKGGAAPQAASDGWDEGWEADGGLSSVFGSVLSASNTTTSPSPSTIPSHTGGSSGRLKARPVPASAFDASAFGPSSPAPSQSTPHVNGNGHSMFGATSTYTSPSSSSFAPLQPSRPSMPSNGPGGSFAPLQPTSRLGGPPSAPQPQPQSQSSGPNYNISLPQQAPSIHVMPPIPASRPAVQQSASTSTSTFASFQPMQPVSPAPAPLYNAQATLSQPPQPAVKPPPGWTPGLMQPSKPANAGWTAAKATAGMGDWGDFDPLK